MADHIPMLRTALAKLKMGTTERGIGFEKPLDALDWINIGQAQMLLEIVIDELERGGMPAALHPVVLEDFGVTGHLVRAAE